MPGEGTGVPGVDPLIYREHGDKPDVDALLTKLRIDAPGAPRVANTQGGERVKKKPKAAKGKGGASGRDQEVMKREGTESASEQGGEKGQGGERARERGGEKAQGGERAREEVAPKGKDAVKRGVNPQWLTLAIVAIVAPVIVLLLVLIMSRTPAPAERMRDATAKETLEAPKASPAIPTAPSAAPSATADVVPTAPTTTTAPNPIMMPSAPQTPSATVAPKAPKGTAREGGPEHTPAAQTSKPKVYKTPEF
jgi:hypothetical protein